MENSIRTFIAIKLNADIQEAIELIQHELKKSGADVKWVKVKNIHLTLKFLGQTPLNQINDIHEIIQSVVKPLDPFSFDLTHLGAFPSTIKPKVIWLGIESGCDQIKQIALALEERLNEIGFTKEDRPFKAHITIGRVKSNLIDLFSSKNSEEVNIFWSSLQEKKGSKLGFHNIFGLEKTNNRLSFSQALDQYNLPHPLTQKAKSISFIQSTLTPQGPIYQTLKTANFS